MKVIYVRDVRDVRVAYVRDAHLPCEGCILAMRGMHTCNVRDAALRSVAVRRSWVPHTAVAIAATFFPAAY